MPYKDPVKRKEATKKYDIKRLKVLDVNARESILSGEIIDQHKWNAWCNRIKSGARKYPYSGNFTNDIMFEMMIKGCLYCGDIATTIDRLDSTLDHTPDNSVGACKNCNFSKGSADPSTFIRKAYYRVNGKYIDNVDNIWSTHIRKPRVVDYKRSATQKGIRYELTDEDFDKLIKSDCTYCKRSSTSWFGIDRIHPDDGYVIGNVAPACWDCNVDKYDDDYEMMMARNTKIVNRVKTGKLVIEDCPKAVLRKGCINTAKKVCVYGQVYDNKADASRALGKSDTYVYRCIKNGIHSEDIFEIM